MKIPILHRSSIGFAVLIIAFALAGVPSASAVKINPVPILPACPGVQLVDVPVPNGSNMGIWVMSAPAENSDSDAAEIPFETWVYYGSYVLQGATLSVGADGYAAGAGISVHGQEFAGSNSGGKLANQANVGCFEIGTLVNNLEPVPFDWWVQGGAYGTSGSSSCSVTVSAEFSVGVEFGLTGTGGSASVTFGVSATCGSGQTFDSELIVGSEGSVP